MEGWTKDEWRYNESPGNALDARSHQEKLAADESDAKVILHEPRGVKKGDFLSVHMNIELIRRPIQAILGRVPTGHIFDSHFVIAALIKDHSDDYLRFVASFDATELTTAQVHGQLAQQIPNCGVPLDRVEIDGVEYESYSENIHGTPNPCACWRRR